MTTTKATIVTLVGALVLVMAARAEQPSARAKTLSLIDQPDAKKIRDELSGLLDRYPPALRDALGADPTLLGNESYLTAYPALSAFLSAHPEVARDSLFYLDRYRQHTAPEDRSPAMEIWRDIANGVGVFGGFGIAAGMIIWLTRTVIDSRRWNRMAKVQSEVHLKLLDRFSNNEELMTYVQSPAGSRFLQSAPISLDVPQRSVGAPLSRILLSMQGGIVLLAGGIGLLFVAARLTVPDAAQPLQALGVVAIALGLGFVASAAMSYLISHRLGLIESSRGSVQNLS